MAFSRLSLELIALPSYWPPTRSFREFFRPLPIDCFFDGGDSYEAVAPWKPDRRASLSLEKLVVLLSRFSEAHSSAENWVRECPINGGVLPHPMTGSRPFFFSFFFFFFFFFFLWNRVVLTWKFPKCLFVCLSTLVLRRFFLPFLR